MTFAIGAGALALLYVFDARAPRAPAPLVIMAAEILAVSTLRLADEYGVPVVGVIHPGFPAANLPKVNLDDVLDLLPGACAIALFILSEALGVGFSLSSKYGYDIDPNQELVAIGVSNVAAACLGGNRERLQCVIDGGQRPRGSQKSGTSLTAATMVWVTLVALMPLFHNLPQAVLSAIVIHAVARMMRVAELKDFPDYALSSAIKVWYKTGTYGCFCGFERWRATRCNFKRGSARPSLLFFTEQRISAGRR